jgi:hypothetical protein
MRDRSLALYHELALHQDFCAVGILMPVEQFSCDDAAEVFYLLYVAVDSLLEYLVNDLKVPGEIGSLQASGKVNENIKI